MIPASEFWTDYYETALEEDELLTEIEIDPLPGEFRTAYTRFTTRSKEDAERSPAKMAIINRLIIEIITFGCLVFIATPGMTDRSGRMDSVYYEYKNLQLVNKTKRGIPSI